MGFSCYGSSALMLSVRTSPGSVLSVISVHRHVAAPRPRFAAGVARVILHGDEAQPWVVVIVPPCRRDPKFLISAPEHGIVRRVRDRWDLNGKRLTSDPSGPFLR